MRPTLFALVGLVLGLSATSAIACIVIPPPPSPPSAEELARQDAERAAAELARLQSERVENARDLAAADFVMLGRFAGFRETDSVSIVRLLKTETLSGRAPDRFPVRVPLVMDSCGVHAAPEFRGELNRAKGEEHIIVGQRSRRGSSSPKIIVAHPTSTPSGAQLLEQARRRISD